MTARLAAAFTEARGRRIVHERSGRRCEICGQRPAESISHRRAKSRGGTWHPSNLIDACGSGTTGCHGWLESHPAWAGDGGWHIRRDRRDPAAVPVYLRSSRFMEGGWALLLDDGFAEPVHADDYGLPAVPEHLPYQVDPEDAHRVEDFQAQLLGRPLATVPWVDPT